MILIENLTKLWTGFDWSVLILYMVGVVVIGLSMKTRAGKSVKSFYVASRKLTVPILVGVGAASWYDSWTIVGLGECGWTMGISILLVFVIPETLCRLPLALVVGPHVRDDIPDWVVTAPDLLMYLYNDKVKLISAITYIANIFYDSALLFAIAEVMKLVSGMPLWVTLAVTGAIIALYTSMSGFWGSAITDLIQFAIMTVSAGALLIGIMIKFGGLPAVWAKLAVIDPKLLTPTGHLTFWEGVGWFISACAMYCEAGCYQRFGSARSGRDIKTAYSIMLAMGLTFSIAMVFAGMAARAFFGGAGVKPSYGFWELVFTVLPIGLRGLFVSALFAAVMSTIESDWLLFSTCLVNDIYRGFINKGLSEEKTVRGVRIGIIGFGAVTVVGTIFWAGGIADAWYYLGGFLFAMFFIPITAGLFYRKRRSEGALACITSSAVLYVVWEFILNCPGGIPSSAVVTVVGAIIYFTVCQIFYKKYGRSSEGGRPR